MAKGYQRSGADKPAVCNSTHFYGPDLYRGVNGARRQARALQREGVQVETGPMGEYTVSLREYGWFPSRLPSELDEVEDSESTDTGDEDAQPEPPHTQDQ